MSNAWPSRIAILGVGLLGGSVAKAIRRAQPSVKVVGWSRTSTTTAEALALGVIDEIASSPAEACCDCDVVIVAAPVDRIAELSRIALDVCPETCLVTDVGSTKVTIVDAMRSHPRAAGNFVGAHPIAGREKAGVKHSIETLFDDKCVILTPDEATKAAGLERASAFWRLTGANVIVLNADQHDAYLAATSHVPHLVSAAVAKLLPPAARPLVGSGWIDTTRIAAGDPEMWAAICRENYSAIRAELTRFAESIQNLTEMLDRNDESGLLLWLAEAKTIRDQIQ
jgi:prephenate dehydrogenase